MTRTATTQTEAKALLTTLANELVAGQMILAWEVPAVVASALRDLNADGAVRLGNGRVRLSKPAQDRLASASIRSMSAASFDRFAYGL